MSFLASTADIALQFCRQKLKPKEKRWEVAAREKCARRLGAYGAEPGGGECDRGRRRLGSVVSFMIAQVP